MISFYRPIKIFSTAIATFLFLFTFLLSIHHHPTLQPEKEKNCSICHCTSLNAKYLPTIVSVHLIHWNLVEQLPIFHFTDSLPEEWNSAIIRGPPPFLFQHS